MYKTKQNLKCIAGHMEFELPTKTHQSALRIVQRTSFNKFLLQYKNLKGVALLKMWQKHLFVSASASKELNQLKAYIRSELERNIQNLAHEDALQLPFDCPVRLEVTFNFPYLKKHSAKDRENRIVKTTKPDLDNTVKILLDCMEEVGLVINDSRICQMVLEKYYSDKPGIVWQLTERSQNG